MPTATDRIDLKPGQLKRPMDKMNMSNDAASLRTLVGFLNNPEVTGAKMEAESPVTEHPELAAGIAGAIPAGPEVPALPPTPPKPRSVGQMVRGTGPGASPSPVRRLFLTGNPKVGKDWLATQLSARVVGFDDPIFAVAASAFGEVSDLTLLNGFRAQVRAWGDGQISEMYPLTAGRAMFVENIRGSGVNGQGLFNIPVDEFGTPGFWSRCLAARVARFSKEFPMQLIVVTDVETPEQYKALQQNGFRAYHVLCNALTRSSRGGTPLTNPLADMIERDITQKISQSSSGGKLWCVWCDEKYPSPSNRFLTVPEFLSQYV